MDFQLSYSKSWKMILWKCCTQYASKFGKLSSGHRTEKVSFHSNPKERQCQRMLKLPDNCTHFTHWQSKAPNSPSQVSAVHELWTSRCSSWIQKRQRNQRLNFQHPEIIEKARESQKNIYFCFIDYAKAIDCVDHNKLWKILQEIGIPDHLTCLLKPICRSGSNS